MANIIIRYTVVLPYVPREFASPWHPTASTGPFSSLIRGNFLTLGEAITWARERLNGAPYSIRAVEGWEERCAQEWFPHPDRPQRCILPADHTGKCDMGKADPYKCNLCGQVITDGKPCGCGAR